MKLAKESAPFLFGLLALALGGAFIHWGWALVPLAGAMFVTFFFRDPLRTPPLSEENFLSPADGEIKEIKLEHEEPGFKNKFTRISIFLSVMDVHVNRSPVSGEVISTKHSPGKFYMAFEKKAFEENENNLIVLRHKNTDILLRQVAGKIARRIVCYLKPGQIVQQGEKIGIIQFGSGAQLYMPAGVDVKVAVGQKVVGGETVLASIQKNP